MTAALTLKRSSLNLVPHSESSSRRHPQPLAPLLQCRLMQAVFSNAQNLTGVHRIQRVPKSEKAGRRHSSVVVVSLVSGSKSGLFTLDEDDLREEFHAGIGKGGQHANKAATSVTLTHVPSGITVKITGRSQWQNRQQARAEITERLTDQRRVVDRDAQRSQKSTHGEERSFSWVAWRDSVQNHRTGKSSSMKKALKGRLGPIA